MSEVCAACKNEVSDEEFLRALGKIFHEDCFKCTGCKSPLGTASFLLKETSPYCTPCFYKTFGHACGLCKKVIQPEDEGGELRSVEAMGRRWHERCWACADCGKPFSSGDKKGAYPVDNMPYCYEHALKRSSAPGAHTSASGGQPAGPDCKKCRAPTGAAVVDADGATYHPQCFNCDICNVSLVKKAFIPFDNRVFCQGCDEKGFTKRCARCKDGFVANEQGQTVSLKAGGKYYHEHCYVCFKCKATFGSEDKKGAYPVGEEIYCYEHAKERKKEMKDGK